MVQYVSGRCKRVRSGIIRDLEDCGGTAVVEVTAATMSCSGIAAAPIDGKDVLPDLLEIGIRILAF
jgi:hypothetical protein